MLAISNYHYIRPAFKGKFSSIFGITPDEFEDQILHLGERGAFIHPNDLVENLSEVLEQNKIYFLLTFDDGLKEQLRYALPILDKLRVPAIFFPNSLNFKEKRMSTVHKIHLLRSVLSSEEIMNKLDFYGLGFSGREKKRSKEIYRFDDENSAVLKYILNFKLDYDQQETIISPIFSSLFKEDEKVEELYMSKREVIELGHRGYLGSHTHSHYPLGLLGPSELQSELEVSKNFLEELTGEKISYVSYPYGTEEACTPEVALEARNVGYSVGLTTKRGLNKKGDNPLMLKRFDCNDLPGGKSNIQAEDEFFQ